jgi:hypothetical protein
MIVTQKCLDMATPEGRTQVRWHLLIMSQCGWWDVRSFIRILLKLNVGHLEIVVKWVCLCKYSSPQTWQFTSAAGPNVLAWWLKYKWNCCLRWDFPKWWMVLGKVLHKTASSSSIWLAGAFLEISVYIITVPKIHRFKFRLTHLLSRHSTTWATPPALFCDGCFQDRVSWTICPGWLWSAILIISATWIARITDVSHQCPASWVFLYQGVRHR